jgi:HEAT repeat protein
MSQESKRKWLIRSGAGIVFILAAIGFWAGMNISLLKARYAGHQLRSATTDEERTKAADQLASLGAPGLAKLVEFIQSGDDSCRTAAGGSLDRYLAALPDSDRRAVLVAGQVLDTFPHSDDACRKAVLGLLPNILKRTGNTYATKCREAIAAGLKMPDPDSRVLSIRMALHPDVKMRSELLHLLTDPEPRVRGAALFGVASVTDGEQVIADEELFRWLHDPDEGVRKVCYDALVSRDRSETEISLARRLSNPDPSERLKLLFDLRYEDDISDPEPWLERLSRDQEPAIRAGATRVVLEVMADRKQNCPGWVARVTDADPDPTVRRVAGYFRRELVHSTNDVRPASAP